MPGTLRSTPAGSGATVILGRGSLSVARAWDTLVRSARARPTSALAPAAATATEPVTRNSRRTGAAGRSRSPGRALARAVGRSAPPPRRAGTQDAPGSAGAAGTPV